MVVREAIVGISEEELKRRLQYYGFKQGRRILWIIAGLSIASLHTSIHLALGILGSILALGFAISLIINYFLDAEREFRQKVGP